MQADTLLDTAYTQLPLDFYERDTETVARRLLGKLLVRRTPRGIMTARIVEVEAYFGPGDPASHACNGPTPRSAIMFGRAGRAYVYLNYGVHYLLNVVTEREGRAGAVLVRALEPVSGIDLMLKNRPVSNQINLTNGPGKLTKALAVDITDNGTDMTGAGGGLFIADGGPGALVVDVSPRIGISAGAELLLRFSVKGNPYVSRR